jgi:hypothetical protein
MGYLSQTKLDEICTRTANGGAEITKLVGTSAWYAPGAAAAEMVEAILKDKKQILPCSVFLKGEYGVNDQFRGQRADCCDWSLRTAYATRLTAYAAYATRPTSHGLRPTLSPGRLTKPTGFERPPHDAGYGRGLHAESREPITLVSSWRVRTLEKCWWRSFLTQDDMSKWDVPRFSGRHDVCCDTPREGVWFQS